MENPGLTYFRAYSHDTLRHVQNFDGVLAFNFFIKKSGRLHQQSFYPSQIVDWMTVYQLVGRGPNCSPHAKRSGPKPGSFSKIYAVVISPRMAQVTSFASSPCPIFHALFTSY